MVFDPTNVPTGIECSDDPLLAFPSAVHHDGGGPVTR
jgi:catalase